MVSPWRYEMKKSKSVNIVGHLVHGERTEKYMREAAQKRYHEDYGFKRGARPASPDKDGVSYNTFKKRTELEDHFFGLRDPREIKMMMAKPHGFAHARTANEGHSVYRKFPTNQKGHLIGKR